MVLSCHRGHCRPPFATLGRRTSTWTRPSHQEESNTSHDSGDPLSHSALRYSGRDGCLKRADDDFRRGQSGSREDRSNASYGARMCSCEVTCMQSSERTESAVGLGPRGWKVTAAAKTHHPIPGKVDLCLSSLLPNAVVPQLSASLEYHRYLPSLINVTRSVD